MNQNSSDNGIEAAPQNDQKVAALKAENQAKIEAGLRDLKKQCKQLSKNQLIATLLRQLEKYAELQGACKHLYEENQKLKEGNKNA